MCGLGLVSQHKHTDSKSNLKAVLFFHIQAVRTLAFSPRQLIAHLYLAWLASATQNANSDFMAILFLSTLPLLFLYHSPQAVASVDP